WDPRFECPVTRPVLDAFIVSAGGTILAGRLALEHGSAASLGGGFHHAYPDHGEGFCLLNDVPVASKVLLEEGLVSSVLIVDLDVHQGNGTAVMCREDPRIFTLSVHQEDNYPAKEVSDLDVGLPDLADDDLYLGALEGALRRTAERFEPDLVFYLAGADPYEQDRLGGLRVTKEGLAERDRMVFDHAEGAGMPVVGLLAGGYALREEDVVDIHVAMVEELLRRSRSQA
ncbi:MAG: histone deacetylase family protein, partial [Planctomycetota bacterium]